MMKEYIKCGFGLYFGYRLAKMTNEIAGEVWVLLKKRIKDGSF